MNTCLIFITNIPKSLKPSVLMKELDNKWAKFLYIDNPYSDLTDAFIYNPTSNAGHYDRCVERLRKIELNCDRPLKVYYVWFQSPTVTMVTMIPEGSILLPYILVDNIPKEVEGFELYGELPFTANDVKEWNIPYKEDKWMVLRLLSNYDDIARNFVLSYTRTLQLPNGGCPRALEILVTEEPRLSKTMVPKCLYSWTVTKPYCANYLFVYKLPSRVASHHLSEAFKQLELRNIRSFLIDVIDEKRLGFLLLPRSLQPADKVMRKLYEKLSDSNGQLQLNIKISLAASGASRDEQSSSAGSCKIPLYCCETWFQPVNCLPPVADGANQEQNQQHQFLLTHYLYIHNINETVTAADISVHSPYPIKVTLYAPTSDSIGSKTGFVNLTEIDDSKAPKVIEYLRSLVFKSQPVLVDEVWLRVTNDDFDKEVLARQRPACRTKLAHFNTAKKILEQIIDHNDTHIPKIILADPPPFSYQLKLSDFVFLMDLPQCITDLSQLLSKLDIGHVGATIMETESERVGILKLPKTSDNRWMHSIEKLCLLDLRDIFPSTMNGKHTLSVRNIYVQIDENVDLIQSKLLSVHISNYVLLYNVDYWPCGTPKSMESIPSIEDTDTLINALSQIGGSGQIRQCETLWCTANTNAEFDDTTYHRYVFARLSDNMSPQDLIDILAQIRSLRAPKTVSISGISSAGGGGYVQAHPVWLAGIKLRSNDSITEK